MTTIQRHESPFSDLARLITLVDGVFAVAMTLLVLDLKLPVGTNNLADALKKLIPSFVVYIIVFASIAGYWTIHHGNFHLISQGDGRLLVLSLVNLLFITLFPLAASIVGAHPLEPLATVCLSVNCLCYCVSAWGIWAYVVANPHLTQSEYGMHRLREIKKIMVAGAIGLALAIPLAFISVYFAYAIWIGYVPFVSWWNHARSKIHPKNAAINKDKP
jgi:TMEM175 potassium channel family protein